MAKYIKTEEGYKRLEDVAGMIPLVDVGAVVLVDNLTYEAYNNGNYPKCTFIVGEKYDVIINGVTYENLTCYLHGDWRVIGSNDECPYYIDDDGGDNLYLDSSIETITIIQQSVKKIPENYLPDDILFVTINEDGTASHSASEINAHYESGGMAWLTVDGIIFYLLLIEESVDGLIAVFCQNIVSPPDGLETVACIVDDNKNLSEDVAQLSLATTKDWNQNDPTAPDYIENRPFYAESLAETVVAEFDFEGEGSIPYLGIEKNKTYMLSIGDNQYVSVCKQHTMEGLTGLYVGNPSIFDPVADNTGEPYLLFEVPGMITAIMTTGNVISSGDHIKIEECAVHKINAGYLPKTSWEDLDVPFGTEHKVEFNSLSALVAGSHAVSLSDDALLVRVCDYMDKDDFDRMIMSLIVNGTVVTNGECQHIGLVKPIGEHSYYLEYGDGVQLAVSLYSQNDCDLLDPNLIPGLYLLCMDAGYQTLYCNLSKPQIKNLGKYIDYFTIPNIPVGTISNVFNVPSTEDNSFGESIDATYANGDTALFYWILPETYTKEKLAGSTLVFKDGTTRIVTSTDYEYLVDPAGTQNSKSCKIADIFIWHEMLGGEEIHDKDGNVFIVGYSGLYVKEMDNPLVEIRFPDEIRKLDVKYLPDEIPTAESVTLADEQTLSLAKVYTNSQRLAHTETKNILVLDAKNQGAVLSNFDPIGKKVRDYFPTRRKLVVPTERPTTLPNNYAAGAWRANSSNSRAINMEYGTYNSHLNKPCFLVTGTALPAFCAFFYTEHSNLQLYDSLLYAYETTKDNIGLGITFEKGWYVLSSTTFAHEPIDINAYPVYAVASSMTLYSNTDEGEAFFNECFHDAETIEYTITKDHVAGTGGYYIIFNTPCAITDLRDDDQISPFDMVAVASFLYDQEAVRYTTVGEVVVYEEIIHPIDPKYLPEGGFGYTEPGVMLTINKEDIGTKYQLIGEHTGDFMQAVSISDSVMDLSEITEYTVCLDPDFAASNGVPERMVVPVTKDDVVDYGTFKIIIFDGFGVDIPAITSGSGFEICEVPVDGGTVSTIAVSDTDNHEPMAWFTDFKFGDETIHPIDPKYLPAGGVGYEKKDIVTVIPATVYQFDESNEEMAFIPGFSPEAGKTYAISVDGKTSTTTAVAIDDDGTTGVVVGNLGAVLPDAYPNTGEDWVIVSSENPGTVLVSFTKRYPETVTIKIEEVTETIHTIDPKYLPEGGFGYTEPGKVLIEHAIVSEDGLDIGLPLIDLVSGKKYILTVFGDGTNVSVEVEAMELHFDLDDGSYHVVYLGNPGIMDGEDNGEVYFVASGEFGADGNMALVGVLNDDIKKIRVESTETIHPINPKYLPEGGVGYSEGIAPITFDGDASGKTTLPASFFTGTETDGVLVMVDSNGTSLKSAESIVNSQVSGGIIDNKVINKDQLTFVDMGAEAPIQCLIYGDTVPLVMSIGSTVDFGDGKIEKGTYVHLLEKEDVTWYVSRVEFDETVHTIDPKFLPDSVFIPTPKSAKIGQTIVVSEVDENGKPLAWEVITPTVVQLITWEEDD